MSERDERLTGTCGDDAGPFSAATPPERGGGAFRVARLEDLEAPFSLGGEERDAYLRRFSTLFVDGGRSRRGGLGRVTFATNAWGERLALKTPLDDASAAGERGEESVACAAMRREYECQRSLALLRGFPRLYAFGTLDGAPAIVMEWVEGVTLAEAVARGLAVDDDGRVSPLTVARIGRDLFELLARLSLVGDGLAHRDVSPANVMIRTARRTLAEQRADGSFDLCLIDFGSAEPVAEAAGSFTGAHAALRRATVGYAPPEMLTDDLAAVARLRRSRAVDVYAAGSVLCELLGGRLPFPSVARDTSPGRHKVERAPERPVPVHRACARLSDVLAREKEVAVLVAPLALERGLSPSDEGLRRALSLVDEQVADTVMSCLAVDQRRRPAPEAVRDELDALAERYAGNVRRALSGEPLPLCMVGTAWTSVGRGAAGRRALRMAARVTGAVASLGVAGATSWLVGEGPAAAAAVAALLLAPCAIALILRGRDVGGGRAFVRGSVSLLACALVASVALWALTGPGARLDATLAALLVCSSATWLVLTVDRACALMPGVVRETRRGLSAPRGDPRP
ncbi:protein kinase domain-containing protein [Thermophilibacter sp.]